jgi:hypothetical protein
MSGTSQKDLERLTALARELDQAISIASHTRLWTEEAQRALADAKAKSSQLRSAVGQLAAGGRKGKRSAATRTRNSR